MIFNDFSIVKEKAPSTVINSVLSIMIEERVHESSIFLISKGSMEKSINFL